MSNGTEKLIGNKGFWASDYMVSLVLSMVLHAVSRFLNSPFPQVHRRESFILTNKMLSTRSLNSESVNGANPYAYHIGQGTLFSYVEGTEYKDIMASWNWNLIPGTTVLLNLPKLQASTVKFAGKRDFVGVVSDGHIGTAVEDYVDPFDSSISYQKAWFFLDNGVLVTTTDVKVNSSVGSDFPVISVLDNRSGGTGPAWVDGQKINLDQTTSVKGRTLLYGGNGYLSYDDNFDLTLSDSDRTGNWSEISTSTVGVTTVPIFSAYTKIPHESFTYAVFPATTRQKLKKEAKKPSAVPVSHEGVTGAAGSNQLSIVFWPGKGSRITVNLRDIGWTKSGSITVTSSLPGVYLFSSKCTRPNKGMKLRITTSDPTQKAASAKFSVAFNGAEVEPVAGQRGQGGLNEDTGVEFDIELPQGALAGSSVSRDVIVRWN